MLYAIIASDIENTLDKRLAARPDHLQRLEALKNEGRLVLAGRIQPLTAMIRAKPALPALWWLQSSIPWKMPETGPMSTPILKPGFMTKLS